MKYILILIFAASVSNSNAQYQPLFGSNQTSWNVKVELFPSATTFDSLVCVDDTLISSVLYKKAQIYRFVNMPPIATIYIREDVTLGKAWYRKLENTTEYLIYDLERSLGDQLGSNLFVDSVYYVDGRKHIRYNPQNQTTYNFTYIEGVGTSLGITHHNTSGLASAGNLLLCHYKNDTMNYVNNHPVHGGLCRPLVSTIGISENTIDPNQILVYPNPTTDAVTFSLPENTKNIQLKLYTAEGKLVYEDVVLANEQSKTISLNAWNGVLFYTLESETTALSGKLVKM